METGQIQIKSLFNIIFLLLSCRHQQRTTEGDCFSEIGSRRQDYHTHTRLRTHTRTHTHAHPCWLPLRVLYHAQASDISRRRATATNVISGKTRKKCIAVFLQMLQLSCTTLQLSCNNCSFPAPSCSFPANWCRKAANWCRKTADWCRKAATSAGKLQCCFFRVLPEIAFVAVALHLEMSEASALTRCHQITG